LEHVFLSPAAALIQTAWTTMPLSPALLSWEHVHQGLVKKEEWTVSTFYDKNNPYTSFLRLLAASKQASKQAGRQANAQVATTRDTMRGDRQ
jgi:hypothetical protein